MKTTATKITPLQVPPAKSPGSPGDDQTSGSQVKLTASLDKVGPGQKVRISRGQDGSIQIQGSGPSLSDKAIQGIKAVGHLLGSAVDGVFGTDPTASTILSVQSLNGMLAGSGVIPGEVTNLFSKNFFSAYTLFGAPLFDTLKLVNDWKVNKAMARLNPELAGKKTSIFKRLLDPNLMVDAAHVVVDLGVVVALAGAMLHFPFLAAIPKVAALATAYGADIVAGTLHGVTAISDGSGANPAGPDTRLTPSQRARIWRAKYSLSSMLRRVFTGEEPLDNILTKKPEGQGKT